MLRFFPQSEYSHENKNFQALWSAYTITKFGYWLTTIAFFVISYELTGSKAGIGFYLILKFLPLAIVPLFINYYFDYWNKKKELIICEVLAGVVSLGQVVSFLYKNIWLFYSFTLLKSLIAGIYEPASNTCVGQIFQDKKLLNKSYSLFTFSFYLGSTLSIGIGGFLTEIFGPSIVLLIDALTFFISAFILIKFKEREIKKKEAISQERTLINLPKLIIKDLKDSSNYILSKRPLKRLYAAHLVYFFSAGGLNYFIPVFMLVMFHKSESTFGTINSLMSVATVLGSLLVSKIKIKEKRSFFVSIALYTILNGIMTGISFSTHTFHIFWPFLVLSCFASMFSIILVDSSIMYYTKEEYHGRISSLYISGKFISFCLGILFVMVVNKFFSETTIGIFIGFIKILAAIPLLAPMYSVLYKESAEGKCEQKV